MSEQSRRSFIASGVSAALMARGLVAHASASGLDRGSKIPDDQSIRELLQHRIEVEKRTVGMAACVVAPDRTHIITCGRQRLSDGHPVTSDTVFEIGSITKVFTALLLADMVRRGELKLDDPVAHYVPADLHVPMIDGRQITLADLATHTSGLPRWPPLPGSVGPSASVAERNKFLEAAARFGLEDLKAWFANFQPEPHPPTAGGWWYSNVGFTLLGIALAHRAGQSFEALLKARVIDHIGLRETTFHPTMAMKPRIAESHDSTLKPVAPSGSGLLFTASGGLVSTPRDFSSFATALLPSSQTPIGADEQILLTVRRPAPWIGGVQALGWEVLNSPDGAFVSKDGVTNGQAASMVFDPDKRLAVVVFSNTTPNLEQSTLSGGGVGAADMARHLLRPKIPLAGQGGINY